MGQIKTVVILGMHRSGTSMTAGILTKLGVDMGKKLLGKSAGNPKGHFEDKDFIELNKKILRIAGGDWKEPPYNKMILMQKDKFRKQINSMIRMKESALWGWKDPRTSLTIELYLSYLKNPYFIVCHRNPLAIGNSLDRRKNQSISVQSGIKLTKVYEERINNFFKKFPELKRLDLKYDSVVANPSKTINEIIQFLGIKVNKNQYGEALEIVLTPKEIQQIRKSMKKGK